MLIDYSPQIVVHRASARIGPHRREIDLSAEFGNRPPAPQLGNPLLPQPSAMKDTFLLRVYHAAGISKRFASAFWPVCGPENLHIAGRVNASGYANADGARVQDADSLMPARNGDGMAASGFATLRPPEWKV